MHTRTYVNTVSKNPAWPILFLKSENRSGSNPNSDLLRKKGTSHELARVLAGQRVHEKPGSLFVRETKKPGSEITQTVSQK
jgi:hypothetical protein